MFKLGDRVRYVGNEFNNRIGLNNDMVGTITYIKNNDGGQPYAVCFDKKYNTILHDAYVLYDDGEVLESFYNYDSYDSSYDLKESNGWFVFGREIVLINNKKGNTKLFREGKQ